jgi:hypothetical protein
MDTTSLTNKAFSHTNTSLQVPQQPSWLPPGAGAVAVGAQGGLYSVDPGAHLRGPTPEDLRAALAQRMQVGSSGMQGQCWISDMVARMGISNMVVQKCG